MSGWGGQIDEVATAVQNVDFQGAGHQGAQAALGGQVEYRGQTETSDMTGWMWKKGGTKEGKSGMSALGVRRRNWNKRFFVVEGTNLLYYADPQDRQYGVPPKGQVVLNDFQIRTNLGDKEGLSSQRFGFTLLSAGREFQLAADNDLDKVRWISHLQHILDKVAGKVAVQGDAMQDATAHYREGNKHLLEQSDLMAIKEYTMAIHLNPAYEDAYYNRGISYLNSMESRLAITDFTQVLSSNPKCASAFNNRGIAHKQIGKVELAISDYRNCLAIDPTDEYAAKNLELCEQELLLKGPSLKEVLAGPTRMLAGVADHSGHLYRQTPRHFFAKRHLKIQGGVLSDMQDDALLRGFSCDVAKIRLVMKGFDEPYCSTVPDNEFTLAFGRQVIRLRAPTRTARDEWLVALGGERGMMELY